VRYNYDVDAIYDPENPPGQKITDNQPLGFTKALLPHPPNNRRKNPVYELTGLNQRQIEMRVGHKNLYQAGICCSVATTLLHPLSVCAS
jgi:hypothetical protein